MPDADDVTAAFVETSINHLRDLTGTIRHCVDQLDDEQVWHRPHESMNSIANLLLHLIGNAKQWITSGVGGVPDTRDRPAEFTDRSEASKAELLARLDAMVSEIEGVISGMTAQSAVTRRRVQGFDGMTGVGCVFHSLAHYYGHTQEIVHMTRVMLGERYRFKWAPSTPEEGAGD